jgi:outer membrane protein assembly factor BamB
MALPCAGDDSPGWHHIRGPKYDGHTVWTGIRLPWPDSGPPILWKIPSGQGFSGFAVAGKRIYTQCQTRAGQYVLCLDLETGNELWRTRYGLPWENTGKWPGPYASPTYSNGKVYYAGCYGSVGCVDADSGKIIWSLKLKEDIGGEMPGFGYACTPLVEDGRVYLAASGDGCSMIALDAEDGSVVWMAGDDSVSYSSCCMIKAGGRNQLIALLENVNIGRDPETGAELWRFPWSSTYDPHCTWPLYDEPYLFRSSPFQDGARVLELTIKDAKPAMEPVWESEVLSSCIFSGVVVDGFVYAFDLRSPQTAPKGGSRGTFKCVELATGAQQWSTDKVAHSFALACGGKLILLGELGTLVIAEANPTEYEELARWSLLPGQLCWTIPAVHDGRLLVRGRESIVCAYLGDPSDVAGRELARGVSRERSPADRFGRWLDRYQDDSFWGPDPADLARWYLFCVLGVFMPALVIAWPVRRNRSATMTLFFAVSPVLALTNMFLLTTLFGRIAFTCPAALYVFLLLTILTSRAMGGIGSKASMILPRIVLIMFGLLCAGYCIGCDRTFFVAGQGFVAGLMPAIPLTYLAAKSILKTDKMGKTLIIGFAAFSVYFWMSALFILWRTSG